MTWLEYLGLEYLLDDREGKIYEGFGAGVILIAGIVCWLLVAIFQGDLVDQGAVVFNILTTILLFILTLIKYIRSIKYNDKTIISMIFYIATLVILLISFIIGLFIPCRSLIFNYEYKGIYSGISNMFYPLIILNLLFPFFVEKVSFGKRLQEGMETIGLVLISLVVFFFIGQMATLVVSLSRHPEIYGHFIQYHNVDITESRKDWEYDDAKDFIEKNLPERAKIMVDSFNEKDYSQIRFKEENDMESFERFSLKHMHNTYPSSTFKDNGIAFANSKWIEEYVVIYKIVDQEYREYHYVKFDYKEYKILDFISEEEYNNAKTINL